MGGPLYSLLTFRGSALITDWTLKEPGQCARRSPLYSLHTKARSRGVPARPAPRPVRTPPLPLNPEPGPLERAVRSSVRPPGVRSHVQLGQ